MDDLTATREYKDTRWRREGDRMVMPPLQSDFLDWLLSDPKVPPTQKLWAEQHNVSPETVREWKKNHLFRMEWERRADEMNVSVERLQAVLNELHRSAVAGDSQAQKLYLQYVEKLLPPKQVERDSSVAHLSDEELVAEIAELIADDLDSRASRYAPAATETLASAIGGGSQ